MAPSVTSTRRSAGGNHSPFSGDPHNMSVNPPPVASRSGVPIAAAVVVALSVALLAGGLVVVVSRAASSEGSEGAWQQGAAVDPPRARPDFVLTDTGGREFDFAEETGGRLTLLFFGYLSCPDVCPVHLATLSAALDQVSVQPLVVFVSVDPDRDSPSEIRSFLDSFDQDFIGLTGSPAALAQAQEAAGLAPATVDGEGDDAVVTHSTEIVAYTADDLAHVTYPFGTRSAAWVADLPLLARGAVAGGS